ncbi:TOMM precursor leader peptide-binding protein [Streptacidiphilus sp. N1-12]|uniref:TOMM leader peptide-binding protein n=2 Tax=Streptacidiphilus alkalitolerans TaxID=3342712 RepID=A0ABV6WAS3_9ACTN
MAELIRRGPHDVQVRVTALGLRDALAAGPEEPDDPADRAAPGAVPVRVYGRQVIVGPLPSATRERPCPRCLARRWQAVRSPQLRDALELGSGTRAAGPWPYATPFAADAVAALVAGLVAAAGVRPEPDAFPDVHLIDLNTLMVRHYALIPDPECPSCGRPEPDTAEGAVLTLGPAPKYRPGVFRLRPLRDYAINVPDFVNPVCGALSPSIVHDVASTSTAATMGWFSMRAGDYLRQIYWGGHGDNLADSARIGIMEGVERYAGMRVRGKATTVTGTLAEFGADAVDPRETGLYSDAFYRDNPWVKPFSPTGAISWVWGYSLRDHRPRLVPEILTYYHTPGLERRFVQESSSGCASGGCLEEAVYFGLMEAVERDAFLLAWYGQQELPEIDPATSDRATTRHMVDRLAMYGYRARFFDTRISFPIPVVTAVAERFDRGFGRMCFGAGAGLDPESALDSALCEIATDAVKLRERAGREEPALRAMAEDFSQVRDLHQHPLVYGIPEMGEHAAFLLGERGGYSSVDDLWWPDAQGARVSADLRDDLERCVSAVTGAGFDIVVVDQTMPEQRTLGLRTVKVLVPGLLPIDFGWSRQRALGMPRLRSALREAGLRERDLEPADFNPAPHPFP